MANRNFIYLVNTLRLKIKALLLYLTHKFRMFLRVKSKPYNFSSSNKDLVYREYYYTYQQLGNISLLNHLFDFRDGIAMNHSNGTSIDSYLFVGYYAMLSFNEYHICNDPDSLVSFWKHIDYLEKKWTESEHLIKFEHNEDYRKFGLKGVWYCGLTQALCASCFIRAFRISGNKKYMDDAKKMIDFMFEPPLAVLSNSGNIWIEEYPSNPSSFGLNSFIFSIIAVGEYAVLTNDELYRKRYDELLLSLQTDMPKYVFRRDFLHNLKFFELCNIEHKSLLILQLHHLYKMTGDKEFLRLLNIFNYDFNWNSYFKFKGLQNKKLVFD